MKKLLIIVLFLAVAGCLPLRPAFDRTEALMMSAIVHKVEGTRVMLRFTAAHNPEIVAFDWFEAAPGHSYRKGDLIFFNRLDHD